jgi:hypothetical protein
MTINNAESRPYGEEELDEKSEIAERERGKNRR